MDIQPPNEATQKAEDENNLDIILKKELPPPNEAAHQAEDDKNTDFILKKEMPAPNEADQQEEDENNVDLILDKEMSPPNQAAHQAEDENSQPNEVYKQLDEQIFELIQRKELPPQSQSTDISKLYHQFLQKSSGQEPKEFKVYSYDLRDDEATRTKVVKAQRGCILYLFKCLYTIGMCLDSVVDPVAKNPELAKAVKQMKKLNNMNWQNHVLSFPFLPSQFSLNQLPDFECIQINVRMEQIRNDPKNFKIYKDIHQVGIGNKKNVYSMIIMNNKGDIVKLLTDNRMVIHQVGIAIKVNMYSMIITSNKGVVKLLRRSPLNNRMLRLRPITAQKNAAIILQVTQNRGAFAKQYGEFGSVWALKYKNDKWAYPTVNEVLEGLMKWYSSQVEGNMKNYKAKNAQDLKNTRILLIKVSRRNFADIFEALDFTPDQMNMPMTYDEDPILGLWNPYSKVSCLILYLYSMELGTPQLYAEANRVARDMQIEYLEQFGPFLQALSRITLASESRKKEGDKVTAGYKLGGVTMNMAGSFLLFRGAPMKDEWVNPYVQAIGTLIMLPGSNSCSKSLKVALEFAIPSKPRELHTPTLFVIACGNYEGIYGVTMDNEAFTAYPTEAEVLLMEGCSMFVLAVDTGVKIQNTTEGEIAAYNGQEITIVHLFH